MLTEKLHVMSFRALWPLTYVLISDIGQLKKKKTNKQTKKNNSKKAYPNSNSFVQMHFIVIYFNYRIS